MSEDTLTVKKTTILSVGDTDDTYIIQINKYIRNTTFTMGW